MSARHIYLSLCLLGLALPLTQFVPWLVAHGPNAPRFVADMFANRIAAFFALDVIVSAIVLIALIIIEGPRAGVRQSWAPIAATLLVGVSFGLPLFLYLRETGFKRRGES